MKQGIYEVSSAQIYPIGKRLAMDERVFRYALVGGAALMGGRGAANFSTAEEVTTATVASALGTNTVTITVVATAGLVANELQGGYLCYTKTRFYSHRIKSHPAAGNGATCVLTLETAIVGHAIAIGDTLIAYHSPWRKVGYSGNTVGVIGRNSIVGMPFADVAIGQYTWLQTWGPLNVCPADWYGNVVDMRDCVFGQDGAVWSITLAENHAAPQHAGFWIPCTYYGGAGVLMEDGGHFLFLQICP